MTRIKWIDTAKALGMFLVFYGHYIEMFAKSGNTIASIQFQIIYSFHMPLFFMISGFFAKANVEKSSFVRNIFLSRMIPVYVFAMIALPI